MRLSRARERLLSRLRTRKGRPREGLVLVEGPRAVATAMAAGARFRFVVAEDEDGSAAGSGGWSGPAQELVEELRAAGVEVATVPPGALADLADTEAPQGILAVAEEPPSGFLPEPPPSAGSRGTPGSAHPWGRLLVLDGIQDPGNAGTLVRTAAAFGMDAVVALDGTVDPWNPKAVRASAGEAFRIPVHRSDWEPFDAWRRERGVLLMVADAGGEDLRTLGVPPSRWALVVGNEGTGPRASVLATADVVVALPLAPGVDSLNASVAGAVLLWALGPASAGDPPDSTPAPDGALP